MAEITSLRPVYQGYVKVFKAQVRNDDGHVSSREIEDHGDAAAVLAFDPERRVALMVEVTRPPLLYRNEPRAMLEAIAGMVDDGEQPDATARREAHEEAGVSLRELEHVATCYGSPGVSAERVSLFLGLYGTVDRTGPGGGATGEDEQVTASEHPLGELWAALEADRMPDLKAVLLLQALRLRRPDLFEAASD